MLFMIVTQDVVAAFEIVNCNSVEVQCQVSPYFDFESRIGKELKNLCLHESII